MISKLAEAIFVNSIQLKKYNSKNLLLMTYYKPYLKSD